jgi:hypothetical protein
MKKVLLTVITVLSLTFVNAQKGTFLIAGEIGYKSEKNPTNLDQSSFSTGSENANTFLFSPKVGYQFNDHFTVGIESTIGSNKSTRLSQVLTGTELALTYIDYKKTTLNLGGFLRYTKSLGGAFSAYADLSVGMLSGKSTSTLYGLAMDNKYTGFYAGINPAVSIDLKNSLWLNFSVGGLNYNTRKADFEAAVATSTFDFNFGKQINIGISKNF